MLIWRYTQVFEGGLLGSIPKKTAGEISPALWIPKAPLGEASPGELSPGTPQLGSFPGKFFVDAVTELGEEELSLEKEIQRWERGAGAG